MPHIENYRAEVAVSVTLVGDVGEVAQYTATRRREGTSANNRPASDVIESALISAVSAARILAAGVDNAEKRRLK